LTGTTAENIVFVGDSAGGNLILSVALRAGLTGIRVPDSIVAIYPACIVRYSASPARLMSVSIFHVIKQDLHLIFTLLYTLHLHINAREKNFFFDLQFLTCISAV